MARNIRKIERQRPQIPARERVAAYARVSTEKDSMMHSLSTQVSYYSELIQRNPAWVYAGVYADNGLSGTSANRPEFQRLLADCRAGKIDRILTKSISRFTRNTVTLLETTRELKALGVTRDDYAKSYYGGEGALRQKIADDALAKAVFPVLFGNRLNVTKEEVEKIQADLEKFNKDAVKTNALLLARMEKLRDELQKGRYDLVAQESADARHILFGIAEQMCGHVVRRIQAHCPELV